MLQILPALNFCGGIENYVMNYYRNIDRNFIQFDFITHTNLPASYEDEIKLLGGKVYKFPVFSLGNLPSIIKTINQFFSVYSHEYIAIHCHMPNASPFYFWMAKKHGIQHRILHSHQPSLADKFLHKIRNYPLVLAGKLLTTDRVACTDLAGKFLFGNHHYTVIRNAIDSRKFKYNEYVRTKIRKKLKISKDTFVVGNIGRFCSQKNQLFLIEIFSKIKENNPNSKMILIGDGEDRQKIIELIDELDLQPYVLLLGTKENVWDYYQAFDSFVFPSLYEGLGIVLIEAQCSGLKVFTSKERVPKDVKITDNLSFIPLLDNAKEWALIISKNKQYIRKSRIEEIAAHGYDIHQESSALLKFYSHFINKG